MGNNPPKPKPAPTPTPTPAPKTLTPEERAKQLANLTPEQRAAELEKLRKENPNDPKLAQSVKKALYNGVLSQDQLAAQKAYNVENEKKKQAQAAADREQKQYDKNQKSLIRTSNLNTAQNRMGKPENARRVDSLTAQQNQGQYIKNAAPKKGQFDDALDAAQKKKREETGDPNATLTSREQRRVRNSVTEHNKEQNVYNREVAQNVQNEKAKAHSLQTSARSNMLAKTTASSKDATNRMAKNVSQADVELNSKRQSDRALYSDPNAKTQHEENRSFDTLSKLKKSVADYEEAQKRVSQYKEPDSNDPNAKRIKEQHDNDVQMLNRMAKTYDRNTQMIARYNNRHAVSVKPLDPSKNQNTNENQSMFSRLKQGATNLKDNIKEAGSSIVKHVAHRYNQGRSAATDSVGSGFDDVIYDTDFIEYIYDQANENYDIYAEFLNMSDEEFLCALESMSDEDGENFDFIFAVECIADIADEIIDAIKANDDDSVDILCEACAVFSECDLDDLLYAITEYANLV